MFEIANAFPLCKTNHRDIETDEIWGSIPWPRKRKRNIITRVFICTTGKRNHNIRATCTILILKFSINYGMPLVRKTLEQVFTATSNIQRYFIRDRAIHITSSILLLVRALQKTKPRQILHLRIRWRSRHI